jgi:hypothetical protein
MSFIKFTLADIRAAVKDKLDDDGFPDDTIDRAANDFQFELFNDNHIRFMETNSGNLEVASGEYTRDLPNNFQTTIKLIVLDDASTFRDITKTGFMNYNDFMESYANYSVATAQKLYIYTYFGEGLRFSSPADAAYNISLDYLRTPTLMTLATDECELPINARELSTLGTLERIMRVNEDYNESDNEWTRLQGMRTAFIKNYGRGSQGIGAGPQVIRTGRGRGGLGRSGGFNAARDF